MGNYSYMTSSELTIKNIKDFAWKLYAAMLCATPEDHGTTPDDKWKLKLAKISKLFNPEDIPAAENLAVSMRVAGFPQLNRYLWMAVDIPIREKSGYDCEPEGDMILNISGWKIHGYYYDDFCQWLYYLWRFGLRGEIWMNEEQDQDFVFRFEDDDIYVDIYKMIECDEDGERIDGDAEPELDFTLSLKRQIRLNNDWLEDDLDDRKT